MFYNLAVCWAQRYPNAGCHKRRLPLVYRGERHNKLKRNQRGSGETLACGTGACAAAVAAVLNGYCEKGRDIRVLMLGGELTVNYTDETVYMTGDCSKVFDGVVEI